MSYTDNNTVLPSGGTANQVLEKVDGTDYNVQWATPVSSGTREHSEDLTESSSTSSTWSQKLRHTTADLANGTYKISVHFIIRSSANNQQMEARAQIDDTTTISTVAYELRPGSAISGEGASHSLKWVGNLSGVTNVDLDFRRPSGTSTVYVSNAHVFIEDF